MQPKINIPDEAISGGSISRRMPSTKTYVPTPSNSNACSAAARISARRYPQVRSLVAGRVTR